MAAGLPDFSSPIDLAIQSLPETIARDKKGSPLLAQYSAIIGVGDTPTLVNITGKGYIYFAVLWSNTLQVDQYKNDTLHFWLDGQELFGKTLDFLYDAGLKSPWHYPGAITKLDEIGKFLAVTIPPGYTFEESIKFQYDCGYAGTFLTFDLLYAII